MANGIKLLLPLIILIVVEINRSSSTTPSPTKDEDLHENQIPSPANQPEPEVIKDALKENFKKMDKDMDKLITAEEVQLWMRSMHDKIIDESIKRQWEWYEPKEGEVHSWNDYQPEKKEILNWTSYASRTFPPEVLEEPDAQKESQLDEESKKHLDTYRVMYKRAERRWKLADSNNDSILVIEEFRDFIHPEESPMDKVKEVLVHEAFEDMDKDKDDQVSYDEYITHLKTLASEEDRNDGEWVQLQQTHFKQVLDKNGDNLLNFTEMKEWLIPGDDAHHEAEGKRLIELADVDKDEKLSINEILEKFDHFLPLLPPDFWSKYRPNEETTDDPTKAKHDEF